MPVIYTVNFIKRRMYMIRNELSEASALSEVLPSLVRPSATEAGRYADGISESVRVWIIYIRRKFRIPV